MTFLLVAMAPARDTTTRASSGGEAILQLGELAPQGGGHPVAEAVVEVFDVGELLAPPLDVDLQQLGHLLGRDVDAVGVDGGGRRQPSDRRVDGIAAA